MKKSFFLAVFLLLVSYCFAQNWDIDLLKDINLHRDRSLDTAFKIVTDYAAPLAYSIPLFMYLFAVVKRRMTLKEESKYVIQSALLALVISTALKYIIHRPRPFVTYSFIQKITSGGSPSFPSGHTSDAFTLAASLSFAYPKWYIILPSYAWALAVGYSRIDLGVHYPSDVLASIMIATLSAFVCYWLKQRKEKRLLQTEEA